MTDDDVKSQKALDQNDKLVAGLLTSDPFDETVRKPPLRVVAPDERPREIAAIASEKALLGALLWSAANAPDMLRVSAVQDVLETGEPFYGKGHAHVYDAMRACREAKVEHDPVAAHAELVRAGRDRAAGGLDGVRALMDEASTVSETQARHYAQQIRMAWARRKYLTELRELSERAWSPKVTVDDLLVGTQALSGKLGERAASTGTSVSAKESATKFFDRVQSGTNTAIATGIKQLDDSLNGGLRPGEVTLIAARTSVGKSVISAQIAEHMVTADKTLGVLYVTLEMTHEMFTARLIAARSGVPLSNLRRMVLNQTQMSAVTTATMEFAGKGLYFADNPTQTLASIYAAAKDRSRVLAREGKRLALVVIDHLGLVKPSAELLKKANREQQVAETSRGQRVIAADIGCHVIGIVQIHREAEKQPTQSMPKLHHLRDTGALENDADTVLILHRERSPKTGMFNRDKPAALAIAKGRLDETALMLLNYDGPRARFSDWTGPEEFGDFYGV
jgi:replicative DNA helicase